MMELVTGGSGSGKSAYAESVICGKHRLLCETTENAPLYYIADMIPYGRETEKKIKAHRKMRAGKGFVTLAGKAFGPGFAGTERILRSAGVCVQSYGK